MTHTNDTVNLSGYASGKPMHNSVEGQLPLFEMKRLLAILMLLIATVVMSAPAHAFSLIQPQTWPPAFNTNNWPPVLDPHNWPFTLFPVPEVATNPNGGVTYGILFAALFKNQNGDIDRIFAPDINNNTDLGAGGTIRYLAYPSEDTQYYAILGAQQNITRNVDLLYSTGRTRKKWWSFYGRFFFERDPTERFFGIGNNSRLGQETNYTTEQVYLQALLGLNLTRDLQVALVERPRYVRLFDGAFNSIPTIFNVFPHVKGVGGGSEVLNELRLTYDSRDSIEIPTSGTLGVIYGSIADRRFMSSFSYTRFGFDLHRYYPLSSRLTLAGHLYMQWMPSGNEAPFWDMGRLGGEESLLYDQQTLRGYGAGRFIDNNLGVANIELRARVLEATIFNTHGILELAPFFDIGRVWHSMSQNPFEDPHSVGGLGFRAIAEPFVVGYVDIGAGGEGPAIFSGINYPF
ncbi:MAG: BamA/TamA family outer membrane protein [Candidatus Binataceae bacterium]